MLGNTQNNNQEIEKKIERIYHGLTDKFIKISEADIGQLIDIDVKDLSEVGIDHHDIGKKPYKELALELAEHIEARHASKYEVLGTFANATNKFSNIKNYIPKKTLVEKELVEAKTKQIEATKVKQIGSEVVTEEQKKWIEKWENNVETRNQIAAEINENLERALRRNNVFSIVKHIEKQRIDNNELINQSERRERLISIYKCHTREERWLGGLLY